LSRLLFQVGPSGLCTRRVILYIFRIFPYVAREVKFYDQQLQDISAALRYIVDETKPL